MNRILAGLSAFSLGTFVLAGPAVRPAEAQVPSPVHLELTGNAGVLSPTSNLIDGPYVDATAESISNVQLQSGFAFGGTGAVQLPLGLSFEGQVLYAPNLDIQGDGASLSTLGPQKLGQANYLAVTGDVLFRVSVPVVSWFFEPFVGAGAGMRRLNFDQAAADRFATDHSSDFAGNVLAGAYVSFIPKVRLRVEARDYISKFQPQGGDSKTQNELALLAGIAFRAP